jgi:hypothetical protein
MTQKEHVEGMGDMRTANRILFINSDETTPLAIVGGNT